MFAAKFCEHAPAIHPALLRIESGCPLARNSLGREARDRRL
jgi:hypothetical protein